MAHAEYGAGYASPKSPEYSPSTSPQVAQGGGYHADDEGDVPAVPVPPPMVRFSFRKLWAFMGPGFLMSIAYMDPGNFESDVQAGAVGGYKLLWVLLWSTAVGLVLQLLAARLGVVTGRHLAEHCREEYPRPVSLALWVMTEIAIIGSDIQEVIGSAIAIKILTFNHVPLWAGVLITAADTFTFLSFEKFGIRKLEAVFEFMILVMAVAFGIEYVISKPDQVQVLAGVVIPRVDSSSIEQAVGLLGATIMPHNIYLHSALVKSRKINHADKAEIAEANRYYAIESTLALAVSCGINMFVVCVFASGFYGVDGAADIGLETAGTFLHDKYGKVALYVWAVGLLAAGQSATMTGCYAGQFAMQGFLNLQIAPWKRVIFTRSFAIVPAVIVALTATQNLDALDEWLNILQSVQLPFAILPVIYLTSDSRVMGPFVNGFAMRIIVGLLSTIVMGINVYFIITFVLQTFAKGWVLYLMMPCLGLVYLAFIFYLVAYIARGFFKRQGYAPVVGRVNE